MDLVERLIPADETVLYEGRAQGYPPLGCTAMGLFCALALGSCLTLFGAGFTAELGSTSLKIPAIVSLLVAFGVVELFRFAAWRSARYVVTTRRVLAINGVFWQSIRWSLRRVGAERAQGSVHWGVELWQAEKLRAPLAGLPLAEVTSVNQALASFDATPPAPFPPPFWTATRLAAAVLLLLALLVSVALLRAAPWRVTVDGAWTRGGGVTLELDSPHSGSAAIDDLDLWYAEIGGALVGRDSESKSMSSGLLREVRSVSGRAYYAIPTNAAVVTIHGAVRRRSGGREVPFELDVPSGRSASLELRALLDAPVSGPPRHFGKSLREWVELLRGEPNEHVRWFLIARVPDVVGPKDAPAVPSLIEALSHQDRDVRWIACRLLAALGPAARQAGSVLRDLAELDPDGGVRTSAAQALSELGAP